MATYRAAYYVSEDRQGSVVLTAPRHRRLSDKDLIAEAIAEAERAGLIGAELPRIPREDFIDRIEIGDWTE